MIPIAIILLLSLVVLIGGLFLLTHAKKENAGKFTRVAAYVSISFSSVIFVGGLFCAVMFHSCHGCSSDYEQGKHHGMKAAHHMGMQGHHGMKQGGHDGCGKSMKGNCKSSMTCSKATMGDKSYSKSEECMKKCDSMKKEQCHESKTDSNK
jgi:hypothetical protein